MNDNDEDDEDNDSDSDDFSDDDSSSLSSFDLNMDNFKGDLSSYFLKDTTDTKKVIFIKYYIMTIFCIL